MNEQKWIITINILSLILDVLAKLPKTEEVAKAVEKPLMAALQLGQILSRPEVTKIDAKVAVDEALEVLRKLKEETA